MIERRYGIAGKAAGTAALKFGLDGARVRSCQDAFVLSRIARAVVDALTDDDQRVVGALRALYETSGKVPLKPSDADDATLLAFVRASREARDVLDYIREQ